MPSAAFPSTGATIASVPLGVDGKVYRTATLSYDTEVKNVSGASIKNAKSEVKITRKGDGRKSRSISGIEDQSIDFLLRNVRVDNADSIEVMAFLAAYNDGTPMDLLFLDGPKTLVNAIGWAGKWTVTKCDREENDEGDIHYAITVKAAVGQTPAVRLVFVAEEGVLTDYAAA
jgi:phage-related protein